jgi:hypothetical protein
MSRALARDARAAWLTHLNQCEHCARWISPGAAPTCVGGIKFYEAWIVAAETVILGPSTTEMQLAYFAHPYGGSAEMLARALRWLRACQEAFEGIAFMAPWIPNCQVFTEAEGRAIGMIKNAELIRRSDLYVMCGGKVSSGMQQEADIAAGVGVAVRDWTYMGEEPPPADALRVLAATGGVV